MLKELQLKLILIQPKGQIVSRWHFAHQGCDCYGFINGRSYDPQWEPTNAVTSGVGAITASEIANTIKETWPDHAIAQVLA